MNYDTIDVAAAALRRGDITSVELTRACLDRIAAGQPALGAFVTVCVDTALEAAAAADRDFANGRANSPLKGIPIAVKDIFATHDAPTTANSRAIEPGWGSGVDAFVVARLRESGAVLVGKATTNEFACGPPDEATGFPVPHNPWNTAHTPDGSSSGSGIAVATGMALGALGTDTGGSIRGPAAANGITGLKPTFGLVSRTGVVPLAHTLDTAGPMARTARDCALLLDVIAGHDPHDQASADRARPGYEAALSGALDGLRVAVAGGYFDAPSLHAEARTATRDVVGVLAAAGAVVRDVDIELAALAADANLVTIACEAFARHRDQLANRWDDYGVHTRRFLATGAFFSADDYLAAQRVRTAFRRELAKLFEDVDLIVTPSSFAPAARTDQEDDEFALEELNFDAPWNLIGLPALALPCGVSAGGLPLSVQFVGRPFAERDVLRAGDAYQQRTAWHLRMPT